MLLKENYNLTKTVRDIIGIYDTTTIWLINSLLSNCKKPDEWLRAKRDIVNAFFEGYSNDMKADSPFSDMRVRCGLCRINNNLFPNDIKFQYPSKHDKDYDYAQVYKTLHLNVCKYMLDYIASRQTDEFSEYMDESERKGLVLAEKAIKSEMSRIRTVEVRDAGDHQCIGR